MITRRILLSAAASMVAGKRNRRRPPMGWQTNLFPLVIVTAGPGFQGVFGYSPGPGAGNLVFSAASHAGVDPYGNAYRAGVTTYQAGAPGTFTEMLAGSLFVGQAGELTAGSFSEPNQGVTQIKSGTPSPSNAALLTLTGGASPRLNVQGANAATTAQFVVAAAGGSLTAALAEIQGAIAASRLDVVPAATAPPARPTGTEPWNAVTFANGWANTAGRVAAQFRLVASPPASVEIIGGVTAPAGIVAGQALFTLPLAYRPVDLQSVMAADVTTGGLVRLAANTNGNVQYQTGAVAGDVIDFHALISLDA